MGRRGWGNRNRIKCSDTQCRVTYLQRVYYSGDFYPLAFATEDDKEREEPHLNSQ